MVAAVLAFTAAGCYLGSAVVARHRAQAAADLAALAGAAELPQGAAAACARVAALTREMRVTVVGCQVDALDVIVTVEVGVGRLGVARAIARAGPVGE